MLFRSSATVGVVTSVCLRDKDITFGIDRHAVQQRAQSIDDVHQLVGFGIKDKQVAVGNFRMLNDIDNVPQGQHIVVHDRMLPSIKGH